MRLRLAGTALHLALLAGSAAAVGGGTALADPVLWLALALLGAWSWSESGPHPRRTPQRSPGWLPVATGVTLAAVVLVAVAHRAASPMGLGPLHLAGAALLGTGARLRVVASRHLGAWFLDDISLRPTHRLITDGPYRWVRHPSEAGSLLIAAGIAALTASPVALVLTAGVLVPLVLTRIRREDALLAELPGWEQWAAQTPALAGLSAHRGRALR